MRESLAKTSCCKAYQGRGKSIRHGMLMMSLPCIRVVGLLLSFLDIFRSVPN